ncbi:MAG: hypothetical protein GC193_05345 [Cryomorphaceae bacterium]|nr:hypothetical protein [Cryomorphaceae bacterium]
MTQKQEEQKAMENAALSYRLRVIGNIKANIKLLYQSEQRINELGLKERLRAANEFAAEVIQELQNEIELPKIYRAEIKAQQQGMVGFVGRLLSELSELIRLIDAFSTDEVENNRLRKVVEARSNAMKAQRANQQLIEQMLPLLRQGADSDADADAIHRIRMVLEKNNALLVENTLRALFPDAEITPLYQEAEDPQTYRTKAGLWAQKTARLINEKLELLEGLLQQSDNADSYKEWRSDLIMARDAAFEYIGKLQSNHLQQFEIKEGYELLGAPGPDVAILAYLEATGLQYVAVRASEEVVGAILEVALNQPDARTKLQRVFQAALNVPGGYQKLMETLAEKRDYFNSLGFDVTALTILR